VIGFTGQRRVAPALGGLLELYPLSEAKQRSLSSIEPARPGLSVALEPGWYGKGDVEPHAYPSTHSDKLYLGLLPCLSPISRWPSDVNSP
jgi:hypothetical protein